MIERNNTSATLERIFDEIYNMVNEASHIPLTDKVVIEANDLADALDELKAAIPKEVRNASQVLEEQKSIVNKAYEEADRILQEEEIVKQANAVAEDIKANALRYQEEVKREADDYAERVKQDSLQYADDMLAYLAGNLQSALQGLSDNRESIIAEKKNLQERPRQSVAVVDEAVEE